MKENDEVFDMNNVSLSLSETLRPLSSWLSKYKISENWRVTNEIQ